MRFHFSIVVKPCKCAGLSARMGLVEVVLAAAPWMLVGGHIDLGDLYSPCFAVIATFALR